MNAILKFLSAPLIGAARNVRIAARRNLIKSFPLLLPLVRATTRTPARKLAVVAAVVVADTATAVIERLAGLMQEECKPAGDGQQMQPQRDDLNLVQTARTFVVAGDR